MAPAALRTFCTRVIRNLRQTILHTGLRIAKRILPQSFRHFLRKLVWRFPAAHQAARLVYDVGMNNGDDTAYYLYRGFRVIAIEASPVLAAKGRERFASEIASGQLTLLNIGIAAKSGVMDFWINDYNADWSSFLPEFGCRLGTPSHQVKVNCVPFIDVLRQYGTPFCLKIDIEGYDDLCLQALEIIPRTFARNTFPSRLNRLNGFI